MRAIRSSSLTATVLGLLISLAACADLQPPDALDPPDATADTLVVAPQDIEVAPGTVVQFTAPAQTINGTPATGPVVWTSTGGTIDSAGRFRSSAAGLYTVRADRGGRHGRGRVRVAASGATLARVELSPSAVSMGVGGTQQFSAVGRMSDSSTQGVAVTYGATGGTISPGGLYSAGSAAGSYRVIATEAGGRADTSAVTVSAAPPTLVAVEVSPASVSVAPGASQQFNAVGRLSSGTTTGVQVTWAATGGGISGSGLYTAGSSAGSFRVIATRVGDTMADTSTVTVQVAPPPPATLTGIELTPASVSLATGATQQFSVVGRRSDGSTQSVTPSYSATGGTIAGSGLYTAGSGAGTFRVIATASGFADTSSITLTAPPPPPATLTGIELTPASVSLATGATQQFSVVGRRSDGSTQSVTPSYSATGGTVSGSGLYTAGSGAGTFRVIATASGFADTSSITLTAPPPPPATLTGIELTPASVSLATGATQQFSVVGRRSDGSTQSVTPSYSATGGTVSGSGLYTAGSGAGTFRVIATASGFADTSSITLTAPPPPPATLTGIELTPASVSLATGATQQFSVVGRRSDGSTQSVTPSYSATGGTVSGSGLYTAGSGAGTFRVIATASGFADTSSITLTAPPAATLTGIELTPASVSLATGATQQFSVTGRRSDGSTQSVTPSYSATGGTIAGSGLYTAGSTAGSFRVIATASGFADTSNITLTTPPPPGSFTPPDLVNLSFNSAADDQQLYGLGGSMGVHQSWDATGGRNGTRAMRIAVNPGNNNGWGPIGPSWSNRGRVFLRWYFRMQGAPGGNVKGLRFHANSSNAGEVYGGYPCWAWDWEPGDALGACVEAGMSYGATGRVGGSANLTCPNLADGNWHSIEVDYDRNAGSNVEVRLWCDGKGVVMPAGSATMWGSPVGATWVGGSTASNTPSTLRTARQGSTFTSGVLIWPTISQAEGSATVWVDDVAASSQRIGP